MSEEQEIQPVQENIAFEYKILTPEAKISILYQQLTELESQLYGLSLEEPIVEDPNHPEWEYNMKTTELQINKYRKEFEALGGNYDFNRMKSSD
tara:strand:+ start:211 stop:492 length:282 start_codon:yes stop_codon:yes gene_type:complete